MEEPKLITVIIPIYNAEKYLEEAIKSVINQTLKNIELILIDDGSKDKSLEICKKYQEKNDNIIVIEQENSGQSKARNKGLEIARGKYIMFLDADDIYENDTCEVMYKIAEENKADYVNANYVMMNDDGKKWEKPAFDQEMYSSFELSINDYKKSFFVMNSTPWNKIYRREFLRENNIKFEIDPPSEDDYFTTLCYMKAKKGYYTNKVIYNYRNNPTSTSNVCDRKYFVRINIAYQKIYDNFVKNKKMGFYRYYYAKKNTYILCKLIDSNYLNDDEKIECLKELSWYFLKGKEIKVEVAHESLKGIFEDIKNQEYDKAIIKINEIKKEREKYPVKIKNRMSYPTKENYAEMEKYDELFKNE